MGSIQCPVVCPVGESVPGVLALAWAAVGRPIIDPERSKRKPSAPNGAHG